MHRSTPWIELNEVATKIINSDRWEEAMRNQTSPPFSEYKITPMRKLIRKMPHVAELVFQRCTTSNSTNPDQPDYNITFNYEFLEDQYANWSNADGSDALSFTGSVYDDDEKVKKGVESYTSDSTILKKNHPLYLMVTNNQEDLLAHPLVTSLLRHKWNSYGRYFYYINLAVYILFVTFLTGYVCFSKPPSYFQHLNSTLWSEVKKNASLDECSKYKAMMDASGIPVSRLGNVFITPGHIVIIVLAAFNICREFLQMFHARFNYIGLENFIEWIVYVASLLFVMDIGNCQQDTGFRTTWQWQLGALAIFLAWIELVLFIRKFPRFGIYVVMFTDILFTFIQFFPVFFLFIIAFGLSYFMIFQNQIPFETVQGSLLKTSVMMIGEFEYEQMFLGHRTSSDLHDQLYYPEMAVIIFILFLILMSVIIMNLLVGLAVDDIKAVQEQAVLKRLAMQVELALDVESILPQFITRRYVVKSRSIKPNIESTNPIKRLMHLESTALSSAAISQALNPELDEMEVLEENQEKMQQELTNLKNRMKNMRAQNEKIESMLTALLKKHEVDWQEEDEQQDDTNN